MNRLVMVSVTLFLSLTAETACAQKSRPSVTEIIEQHDSNSDGLLVPGEVEGTRHSRSFPRWDKNKDGEVTSEEIIEFRKKFGINEDGTRKRRPKPENSPAAKILPTPSIDDLERSIRKPAGVKNSSYILKTEDHPVVGTRYVVLTDHTEDAYLTHLEKLSDHHQGTLIQVDDLSTVGAAPEKLKRLRDQLITEKAKWVAIAPRQNSFSENTLLSMWKLLSTLDDDPQIDVFPGFLFASNPNSLALLIQQSIEHKPAPRASIKPLAISQVRSNSELRSLQKASILKNWFGQMNLETPIVLIYSKRASDAPRIDEDRVWNLEVASGKKGFLKEFPPKLTSPLNESNMIVMHGHGSPGMSCSIDNGALPDDLKGKAVFSGSCFSAVPPQSDLPAMKNLPGGYEFVQREAFSVKAIDNGAKLVFGHQRLSSGFPHLFPVLEEIVDGKSTGQAYQELLNGLIKLTKLNSDGFMIPKDESRKRVPQNRLLYVLIGDPAMKMYTKKLED